MAQNLLNVTGTTIPTRQRQRAVPITQIGMPIITRLPATTIVLGQVPTPIGAQQNKGKLHVVKSQGFPPKRSPVLELPIINKAISKIPTKIPVNFQDSIT